MIHNTDPFATPEQDRRPVRRLRGRLVTPVTLWTAPGPAGLTVSSVLIVDGEPGRVIGLIDEESDLWPAIKATRRFTITPLAAGQRLLADRFAGLAPAPGGLFAQDEWVDTDYGPVLAGDRTWAGCVFDAGRGYGWGVLVEGTIEQVTLAAGDAEPLAYHRGRYRTVPQ
ncbi:MAG TPA: flavin reductase family protein [Natronosporangium sp.]